MMKATSITFKYINKLLILVSQHPLIMTVVCIMIL